MPFSYLNQAFIRLSGSSSIWTTPYFFALAALAVSLFLILTQTRYDLWIYATSPLLDSSHSVNPLTGYSAVVNGRIFHQENAPSLYILNSFLLSPPFANIYSARPMYPFLVSIVSPITGAMPALLIVNTVAWVAAAYCAIKFTAMLTKNPIAPWLAVIFIVLGQGYWFHLTDFSAHLLNHSAYIISAYVLVKIGLVERRLRIRDHAIATATMTAMALTYNTGLALVAVYVLFGLWSRQRFVYIACALFVLVAQRSWPFFYTWSIDLGSFIQAGEGVYLSNAIDRWLALARHPAQLFQTITWHTVQIVASDPLNITILAISIVGLVSRRLPLRYDVRILLFVAGIAPMILALPWTAFALARGYIANAGYGVLAVLAAVTLCELKPLWRYVAAIAVAMQMAWLASALLGNIHPTKIYFIGMRALGEFPYALGSARTTVASLTGMEGAPVGIGGHQSAADAGARESTNNNIVEFRHAAGVASNVHVWANRMFVFVPIAIAIMLLVRYRLGILIAMTSAYLLPPIIAKARQPEQFSIVWRQSGPANSASVVMQEARLSEQVWNVLGRSVADRNIVEVLSGLEGSTSHVQLSVGLCGQQLVKVERLPAVHWPQKIDHVALENALKVSNCDRTLRLTGQGLDSTGVKTWMAWQRNGLPHRRLFLNGAEVTKDQESTWPVLELRIRKHPNENETFETLSLFF